MTACSLYHERERPCVTAYINQDMKRALGECTALANQGNTEAEFFLGKIYYPSSSPSEEEISIRKAAGIQEDNQLSIYWLTQAAEKGNARAQEELGARYYALKEYSRALYYKNMLAEQHHSWSAMNGIAKQYQYGIGVNQDTIEAYKWYILGYYGNGPNTCRTRKELEAQMTPEQVAEAKKRAYEWGETYWKGKKVDRCPS